MKNFRLQYCCTASILVLATTAGVGGCKQDDDTGGQATPVAAVTSPPAAELQSDRAAELHIVIERAWTQLMDGDSSEFAALLNAKLINGRIIENIRADANVREQLEDGLNKQFPIVRDRLLRNLNSWRGGYSKVRAPVVSGSEFDVEIEQYHTDSGLNFFHLICARTPEGWAIIDFFSDSDGIAYTKNAARLAQQAMAGQLGEGDVHRLKRLGDFMLNQDYESFRRAYNGLPESLKSERMILMWASNSASMLELPEWADEIRQRYIDTYGEDETLLLFELDYHAGRGDWEKLAESGAVLNERKGGSAPVLYLKAIAELSNEKPQECVDAALEGIKVDPNFNANWLQAVAGYCELKQYNKATDLVSRTFGQFPDLEVNWSADVFPGLTDSAEFQVMVATRDGSNEDAPPPGE